MIEPEDVMNVHKNYKYGKYELKLEWPDGTQKNEILPAMTAPISTIKFWINYLNLHNISNLLDYEKKGYPLPKAIAADLHGFYFFYTVPRYKILFILPLIFP